MQVVMMETWWSLMKWMWMPVSMIGWEKTSVNFRNLAISHSRLIHIYFRVRELSFFEPWSTFQHQMQKKFQWNIPSWLIWLKEMFVTFENINIGIRMKFYGSSCQGSPSFQMHRLILITRAVADIIFLHLGPFIMPDIKLIHSMHSKRSWWSNSTRGFYFELQLMSYANIRLRLASRHVCHLPSLERLSVNFNTRSGRCQGMSQVSDDTAASEYVNLALRLPLLWV